MKSYRVLFLFLPLVLLAFYPLACRQASGPALEVTAVPPTNSNTQIVEVIATTIPTIEPTIAATTETAAPTTTLVPSPTPLPALEATIACAFSLWFRAHLGLDRAAE